MHCLWPSPFKIFYFSWEIKTQEITNYLQTHQNLLQGLKEKNRHLRKPCTFIPRLLPENPWNSFPETGLTSGLYESISFIISFSEGRFNNLFPGPDLTSKDLRLYSLGD